MAWVRLRENLTNDPLGWPGINGRGGELALVKRQSGYTLREHPAFDPSVRREREGRRSGKRTYAVFLNA